MIKLIDILKEIEQEQQVEEGKVGSIVTGLGLAAATMLGGAKAQTKAPADNAKPAVTRQATSLKGSPDVMKVQTALQNVRNVMIDQWKKGNMGIKVGDVKMYPNSEQDVQTVDQRFMPIVKAVTMTSSGRVGTAVDGKIGEYTSKYKFPIIGSDTTHILNTVNGKVVKKTTTVTSSINQTMLKAAMEAGITLAQMREWNDFVDWLIENGYAGQDEMNNITYSKEVLQKYKDEVNPKFWVEWK